MRILPVALILLLPVVALADADERVTLDWQDDTLYTTTEVERVENNTTFEFKNSSDERIVVVGLLTDRHERTVTRRVLKRDDEGASTIEVHVARHRLTRHQQPPGEQGSKLEYEGDGHFNRARWTETWENDHWRRRLVEAAYSQFGEFPSELLNAMTLRPKSRTHFMLPPQAVTEGAEWTPETAHLLERLAGLKSGDDPPKVEAKCTLKALSATRAEIVLEWKITGLKPVGSELKGEWKDGVEVTTSGSARIVIDRVGGYVTRNESETTLELEGELWSNGRWINTRTTMVSKLEAVTEAAAQNKVAED